VTHRRLCNEYTTISQRALLVSQLRETILIWVSPD
jgi:hypothetical protein